MVIDTSALVAILQDEPERRRFNEAIEQAPHRLLSAANLVEISIDFAGWEVRSRPPAYLPGERRLLLGFLILRRRE